MAPENGNGPAPGSWSSTPLSFEEVKALVEAANPKVRLELDGKRGGMGEAPEPGRRGRYLVARRPLKAGEVVLCEWPLFRGHMTGQRSRQVYQEDFVALAKSPEVLQDDDQLHPCSPIVDCVAGVLLAKSQAQSGNTDQASQARARLRLRQLETLCRTGKRPPAHCVTDLLSKTKPEFRALTSEAEMQEFLHAIGSNRFSNCDSGLELMFAGSMFEHSCLPNCFLSSWQEFAAGSPSRSKLAAERQVSFRALQDLAEGEALSIDYLLLPDGYLPYKERSEVLARWGFSCRCLRCTTLPEFERSFNCAACGKGELCPRSPGAEDFMCQSCGAVPEAAYLKAILAREALVKAGGAEDEDCDQPNLLGPHHSLIFQALWAQASDDGLEELLGREGALIAVEALCQSVGRLYGDDRHPLLLDLYHTAAELASEDLEEQKRFLADERGVLSRYFPEEVERQDAEIMALVQGHGPFGAGRDAGTTGLDTMD